MSYHYYGFGLVLAAAALLGMPLEASDGVYEPTEFLARWDRRYRLIDPDVEPQGKGEKCDYAAAASELKAGVVTGIPDEEMYYRLGFCYERLGDYDRALDAYSSAAAALAGKHAGGPLAYYVPYHVGVVNARKGRYVEAAAAFEKAVRFPQAGAAAHNNLGYCYNKLSLKRKALEEFKNAASENPRPAEAFLNMGNTQAELGDLAGAEASLQTAVRLQPDMPGGSYSLGLVQRALGKDAEAERSLKAAVESVPADAKAHLALARIYFGSGHIQQARAEADVALKLSPSLRKDDPDLFRALAKETGDGLKSCAGENDERVLVARAQALAAQGDLSGAEKLYAAVLGRNPRCIQACLGMAYLNEFAGGSRYGAGFPAAESISFYVRALEIEPELGAAWFNLGNVYEKSGMYAKAVEAFTKAKEFSPGMRAAAYNLGVCYGMIGEREKAKEQFIETLRIAPDFAPAHFQCGVIFSGERDYGRAIEAYENALRLDPRDGDAHFNLAQIYKNQAGKPGEAAEHFKAYLALAPDAEDAPRVREWVEELEKQ